MLVYQRVTQLTLVPRDPVPFNSSMITGSNHTTTVLALTYNPKKEIRRSLGLRYSCQWDIIVPWWTYGGNVFQENSQCMINAFMVMIERYVNVGLGPAALTDLKASPTPVGYPKLTYTLCLLVWLAKCSYRVCQLPIFGCLTHAWFNCTKLDMNYVKAPYRDPPNTPNTCQ